MGSVDVSTTPVGPVAILKNLFSNEQVIEDLDKVYEVDTKHSKLIKFVGPEYAFDNVKKLYALDTEHQLQRVAIYAIFESRQACEEASKQPDKRLTLPVKLRTSEKKVFDKDKFLLKSSRTKSADTKKSVKAAADKVLAERQETLSAKKRKAPGSSTPKQPRKPREKKKKLTETTVPESTSDSDELDEKEKGENHPAESKSNPNNDSIVGKDGDSSHNGSGKKETPSEKSKPNSEPIVKKDGNSSQNGSVEEETSSKVQNLNASIFDGSDMSQSGPKTSPEKQVSMSNENGVKNDLDDEDEQFLCNNEDCIKSIENLREQYQAMEAHFQGEMKFLKDQMKTLTKAVSDISELQDTMKKCHGMLVYLKNEEDRRRCPLEQLEFAVKDHENVVAPEGLVYIGDGRFVEKKDIVEIEKGNSFKVRTIDLLKKILNTEDIGKFCLTAKESGREEIQDYQVEATHTILESMKWGKKCPLPQGFGIEYVRRQVGKICSHFATKEPVPANGVDLAKLMEQKRLTGDT